jgi:hypothetical protein
MMARLLQQAGLYLGPEDRLLSPDSANPDGHFEHTGFLEINNALLQRLGGSWDVPPRMEAGWELDASLDDIRDKARSLVNAFQDKSPWGWKEPRTTILLPFWNSIISNLRFVICVRSPLDVAKSLVSRNQMPIDYGVYLWNRYMRAAIHGTAGYPRRLTFYEHFFGDGVAETRRLLEFCRLECTSAQSVVESEIRSELRHHSTGVPELLDESSILSHPKLLYIGLRAISACGSIPTAQEGESSSSIAQLLKLLDEFYNQEQFGQLEKVLAEKTFELKERDLEIISLKNQLTELQQRAYRLQMFSDAVRQTWAYRVYGQFIKPLKTK